MAVLRSEANDYSRILGKIRQLTTSTGIYQFGKRNQPDPSFGYALEDQARALIVAHQFRERKLEQIYLNFILLAQRKDGLFNQLFYEDSRGFVEDSTPITVQDKEEAYGTTLWALLSTDYFNNKKVKPVIDSLLKLSTSWVFPRSMAATLLGLAHLPQKTNLENDLTEKLLQVFQQTATPGWPWFENHLTYANAILPWALWEIILKRNDHALLTTVEKSTLFLIETCQSNRIPHPIGNKGWFSKGGQKSLYDQQPIDAAYMVCCLEKAYLTTKNPLYQQWAKKWWDWFFGKNTKGLSLVDKNFACHDGLNADGINKNQGGESNICFLMAYLVAQRMKL